MKTHAHDDHNHASNVKKIDKLSSTRVKITVEFSSDVLARQEKSLTQRYASQAKLPGFRPGKAPLQMIQSKYRDEIRRDVLSHLLEAGLADALEKTKLNPISQPKLSVLSVSFDNGKPFEFEAEFDVQPEIELKKYKDIPLVKRDAEVAEEEISKALDDLRERLAVLEPHDAKKGAKGEFAVVEIGYELTEDASKNDAPKPYTVEIGGGKLMPEIETALEEMEVGEKRDVVAKFPEGYGDKNVDGKEAKFSLNLLELKKKVLPELNDTLANQLKEGSTLESIKGEIRDSLKAGKEEENEKGRRSDIIDYLIANNAFDVPQSMVEKQGEMLVNWMQDDFKKRGYPQMQMKAEEMESVRKRAEFMVRSSLLLREIAIKESITLDEQLLNTRIDDIASKLNRSVEDTKKWLSGKGMVDKLRDEILTDQVFEFLSKHASVAESAVSSKK